jgi:hypothetical protein
MGIRMQPGGLHLIGLLSTLGYANALDEIGGCVARLKVLATFPRPRWAPNRSA